MASLRIGLLVDTPLKRQYLALSVREAGHQLVVNQLVSDATAPPSEGVDAWLVDTSLSPEGEAPAVVDTLLEQVRVPLIVSDSSDYHPGSDEHTAWLKRTLLKLRHLAGDINLQTVPRATQLWVLAASTGGPAAVKTFLSQLPPGLGVAFVYVQHIDANYTGTLVKMMSQSPYPAVLASAGAVLQADRLVIVSAGERADILENGTLGVPGEPWSGPYAPSVDELVANAARVYADKLGLIVFTGMGEDGACAARLVRRQGGQVWAQTPDSCTSSSMPDSALATGCVSVTGTPSQLAEQLARYCRASAPNTIEERQTHEHPAAH